MTKEQPGEQSGFDSAAAFRELSESRQSDQQRMPSDYQLLRVAKQKVAELSIISRDLTLEPGDPRREEEKYGNVFLKAPTKADRFTITMGDIDQLAIEGITEVDSIVCLGVLAYSDGSPYSPDPDKSAAALDIVLGLETKAFLSDLDQFESDKGIINLRKDDLARAYLKAVQAGEPYVYEELDDQASAQLMQQLLSPVLVERVSGLLG